MGHIHNVTDSDNHFTINPITRAIKGDSTRKTTLIQHDHNSERFSFDLPRYIDGHDMLLCDVVQVHYINVDAATKEQHTGLYEVTDLKALAGAADMLTCSWLISNHATGLVGSLYFLLRFCCTQGGAVTYAWNTAICDAIAVSAGIDNGEAVAETYPDIIAEWRAELFEAGGDAAHNVQAAQAAAIAAIEEAGQNITETGENVRAGLVAALANAIKGKLSGEIVTAGDVSPIPAEMAVSVRGKNLIAYPYYSKVVEINGVTITDDSGRLTFNGTATKNSTFTLMRNGEIPLDGYYTLSGITAGTHTTIYLQPFVDGVAQAVATTKPVTYEFHGKLTQMSVFFKEGQKLDNVQIAPQLEAGTAATEFTPYIPPETVTVRACGKNLLDIDMMCNDALSKNTDGSYSLTNNKSKDSRFSDVMPVNVPTGAKITISAEFLDVTTEYKMLCMIFKRANGGETFPGLEISEGKRTIDVNEPLTGVQFYLQGTEADGAYIKLKNIQLEIGDTATEYEPYTGAEYPAAADGSVPGVLSVAPNLTLLTDTTGVTIDCEYNRDTNKVIEKLAQAVEALGGSV